MSHYPGYNPLQENQNYNYSLEHTIRLDPNHPMAKGMHTAQQVSSHAMAPAQTYSGYPAHYQHQVPLMHQAYHQPHQQQPPQYTMTVPQMTLTAPPPQQDIAKEWEKIRLERQKLEVLEEKIQVDQELLKQEKRQRRRDRQKATQELHAEWQREIKLLQERSLQVKEEYEAKLIAQKQESDVELKAAKKAIGQFGEKEKALQQMKTEHENVIRAMNKSWEEEKRRIVEAEERSRAEHELQLQALKAQLEAKENQLQNDLKLRQQQWLDKLHAQEQKQQERVEDLKTSLRKEYEIKVVKMQDELEERSSKTSESDFQQKMAAQLAKAQTDYKRHIEKLQRQLQERDNDIKRLKGKGQDNQVLSTKIEQLQRKLAEKDSIVEELTRSLEDANSHAVHELAQPSIVQELETQILELKELSKDRDVECKTHSEKIASLVSRLDEKEKMVSQLEGDLMEAARERDDEAGLQQMKTFNSLKETLTEREETIETLNSRVQELEAATEKLQTELREREETIVETEAKLPGPEGKRNEDISELQDKVVDLEGRLADKDETVRCLQERLSGTDQEHSMALHQRESIFQEAQLAAESTIKSLEWQVRDLEERLEEARRLYDTEAKEKQLADKDVTIQELEQQVANLKQERDDFIVADVDTATLNKRLKEKEEAVGRLEAELRELRETHNSSSLEMKLAEKDEALSRLEGQLMDMERELETKKTCQACQALREELAETQGKYHGLQAEKVIASSTAEDYLKVKKEMSQFLRREEHLKERIEKQQQEIQVAKKMNEELQAQLGDDGSNPQANISRLRTLQRLKLQQNQKQVMEVRWRGSSTVDSGIYTGFINNLGNPDGLGTLKFEDGSIYDGQFKDGNLHGQGVFAWVDGDTYNGEWFEGRQHGYGVFVWADGRLYQGYYRHGQRDGEGLMTWPYGARYKGMYRGDKRNGYGVYNYPDGRVYKGDYQNERPHGFGTEIAPDGSIICSGEWVMGDFQPDSTEDI